MNDLILIPHKEITEKQIEEIINIKTKAWPYCFEKQLEWIDLNIKPTDIHVMLSQNKKNIAYLNLIDIVIEIDGTILKGFGIGNVCASEKGKGWGIELIAKTNLFLVEKNRIGLLFCKTSLTNFYMKNNWNTIEKERLTFSFDKKMIETMIFNYNKSFKNLIFSGKMF